MTLPSGENGPGCVKPSGVRGVSGPPATSFAKQRAVLDFSLPQITILRLSGNHWIGWAFSIGVVSTVRGSPAPVG